MELHEDCERMLFSAEEIAAKVKEVARRLDEEYAGAMPVAVCIL